MTSLHVLDAVGALRVEVSHVVRGVGNRTGASAPRRRQSGHHAPSALSRRRTAARLRRRSRRWTRAETPRARGSERGLARNSQCAQTARVTSGGRFHPASCRCCGRGSRPHRRVRRRSGRASDRVNGVRANGPGSLPDERRRRRDPMMTDRRGEGPVLCGSVDERRAGKYMAEVRTSSQSERPCAAIEETRTASADAGGSKDPGQRKVHSLIDKVYAPANLAEAWRHVRDKKGGARHRSGSADYERGLKTSGLQVQSCQSRSVAAE